MVEKLFNVKDILKQDLGIQYVAELAYWAGFIDGEGYIGIYKYRNKDKWHKSPTYSIQIGVALTDRRIIEQLCALFPGSRAKRKHRYPNSKTQYYWQAKGNRAAIVLTELLPFLRIKKTQARLALEFHKQKGKNPCRPLTDSELNLREEYYRKMRSLNSKGKGRKLA
jgi:hypothetical protein